MERRNFFKFLFASFLTIIAGEFQVNFLVLNKGIKGYLGALAFYIPFIVVMYLFNMFLDYKISAKRADLFCYFGGGLLGLIVYEWLLIGNAPWAGTGAIQAGMFAWWAAIPTTARIFTTKTDFLIKNIKLKVFMWFLIYSIFSTTVVVFLPINLRPAIAAILMSIGLIVINFQFVPFFVRNGSSRVFLNMFMWSLVLLFIANLFI